MTSTTLTERDILEYAEFLGFGEINMEIDPATGMRAIIAVHSNKLGPAIGGTRFVPYASSSDAIIDALRLARMMSYKAAICGLKHGGGKSVLIKHDQIPDRARLFERFGKFVDRTQGRYIAAMDSGTDMTDMDAIAKSTQFVTCTTDNHGNGDPAPHTALGVVRGIEASVKFKLGRDSLRDVHIAIQGVGHVGWVMAKMLTERGAKLTVCDLNPAAVTQVVNEYGATAVGVDEIYDVPCDVFSPCALGSSINTQTIDRLQCAIVAGSANNQLAHRTLDEALYKRGILFAPDFLINAGGLIHVAEIYDHGDKQRATQQIINLYDEAIAIFERAQSEKMPTNHIASMIAEERLNA